MRRAVLCCLIFACGDNVTGTAFEDFDRAATEARCARLARCGLFADAPTCEAYFRRRPDAGLAAAVKAGKVLYNGVAADACDAALAALSCDLTTREVRTIPAACKKVFEGTLPLHAECQLDAECITGACDQPATCAVDQCCAGTCAPSVRSKVDGPCTTNAGCVDDAFCGPDQLCHPLAAEGDECRRDGDCGYGLACIGPSDLMPGNCRAMGKIGDPCPYLRCAEEGAACSAQHRCVPVGLEGAPCTAATANVDCSPFLVCDDASHTCIDTPALDQHCTGLCAGEAYCEPGTNTCTTPMPNGSPCGSDDQCASLFCAEGPIFDSCTDRIVCF